ISASISPTRCPCWASATARLTDTVDFPTPPFPEETASTLPRFGISTGVGGGGTPPAGRGAAWRGAAAPPPPPPAGAAPASVRLTRTAVTPSTTCKALLATRARGGRYLFTSL